MWAWHVSAGERKTTGPHILEAFHIYETVDLQKKQLTQYLVAALKSDNTLTGWLSSVKTVVLKRNNTHCYLNREYFWKMPMEKF